MNQIIEAVQAAIKEHSRYCHHSWESCTHLAGVATKAACKEIALQLHGPNMVSHRDIDGQLSIYYLDGWDDAIGQVLNLLRNPGNSMEASMNIERGLEAIVDREATHEDGL